MSEHVRLEKGKISELLVISELLNKGFEVYTPVVDTGIDCIVKSSTEYFELQIKGTKYRVSTRRGKGVNKHAESNPERYFLIFVSNKKSNVPNENDKDIFYLSGEQVKEKWKKSTKKGTISFTEQERNDYVKAQSFDKLVEKIKFCLEAQSIPCS